MISPVGSRGFCMSSKRIESRKKAPGAPGALQYL